jgi:hypothetical protein
MADADKSEDGKNGNTARDDPKANNNTKQSTPSPKKSSQKSDIGDLSPEARALNGFTIGSSLPPQPGIPPAPTTEDSSDEPDIERQSSPSPPATSSPLVPRNYDLQILENDLVRVPNDQNNAIARSTWRVVSLFSRPPESTTIGVTVANEDQLSQAPDDELYASLRPADTSSVGSEPSLIRPVKSLKKVRGSG